MKKWCYDHPIRFSIYYFIFYLVFFFTLEKLITTPVWIVHSPLDNYIPFVKYAIIPYCLWFPCIAIMILGHLKWASREEYLRTCFTLYIGMTLCLLFYCIVPNGLNIRPDSVEGNDLCAKIIRMIWASDTPMNVCPSLHVYVSVVMDLSWTHSSILRNPSKKWIRVGIHLLDFLICASTVLLKQHSIIDVFAGLTLAIVIDLLMQYRWSKNPSNSFIEVNS